MRERTPHAALPRAPTPDGGPSTEGRRVAGDEVRCPRCDKLLAERLAGTLIVRCPRCKERVTLIR